MADDAEALACAPIALNTAGFNQRVVLPHGLQATHIQSAMGEFLDFVGFVNQQLHTRAIQRLETMLMPANFSSIVGEFMTAAIPKYCVGLIKNKYHNGHPDMIPAGVFPGDAAQRRGIKR